MNDILDAKQSEINSIAKLWYEGWHDAHAKIVPEELTRIRTFESFVTRVERHLLNTRVGGDRDIKGFCMTKGDELFQLYVSQNSRGTGLAKALVADAERQISSEGFSCAWLACAIGNDRAAKFYKKCGWELTETIFDELELLDGTFPLKVWKFEKQLAR